MRPAIFAALISTLISTTAIAQDLPAYHGFGHQMPPPINMVGAGFNLEHAAVSRKAATYAFMAGGALTGILATANGTKGTAAPWITGSLTMGLSLSLNLHGLRWEDRAADLWQCGYSPDQLWETIPDSLGQGALRKVSIPRMIDGTKIRVPASFR